MAATFFPTRIAAAEPWTGHDIGTVGLAGSSSYDPATDTFALTAAGSGIVGVRDGFRFVHGTWNGDAQLIARVDAFAASHPWAKAGVMLRQDTSADAPFAAIVITKNFGVQFFARARAGDTVTQAPPSPAPSDAPATIWLKLLRVGTSFRGYHSTNGLDWIQIGAADVVLPSTIEAGLLLTSHDTNALASARFSQTRLVTPAFGTALFVTGSAAPSASEQAIKVRLEKMGYVVELVRSPDLSPASTNGKSIVLVSDTAGALPAALAGASTPIVTWNGVSLGALGLTGPALGQDFGLTDKKEEAITIASPDHPLASGFTGSVKVALPSAMTWGKPASTAIVVATGKRRSTEDMPALFAYEGGASLANGAAAPARRVGLFLTSELIGSLRDDGWRLFEAAIAWAANVPPNVVLTAPPFGTIIRQGTAASLQAIATDPDGSIVRVEFYVDTVKIAETAQQPYSAVWPNPTSGVYLLTAVAVDNRNGRTTSEPVAVIVNAPPTIALTSPLNNAIFQQSQPISLVADARDSDGTVTKVTFFDGIQSLGDRLSSPYTLTWNNASLGYHTLSAKAWDNNGADTQSANVRIFVNAPPLVALTAPKEGAFLPRSQAVQLIATASDPDGTIKNVEFLVGDNVIGQKSTAPFELSWTPTASGAQSLKARATDNYDAQTTSAEVHVTVNAPPTVALTSPNESQVFSIVDSIPLAASASDDDGQIKSVEFFADGQSLKLLTSAPYTFTWTGATAGTHQLTAVATDNAGLSTTSAIRTISVLTDKDGDGLPDDWEIAHFGNLNARPEDDPDGDGLTNLREFQTGRDPNLYEADAIVLAPPVIALWLRGDRGLSLADGAAVARWLDQSGQANNAVAANTAEQPVFVAGQVNGLPVVRFDGQADRLAVDLRTLASSDYTIIGVTARRSAKAPAYFVGGSNATGPALGLGYSSDTTFALNYGANLLTASTSAFSTPVVSLLEAVFDRASGHRLLKNGKQIVADTNTTAVTALDTAFVGGDGTAANAFAGDLAEVIVYRGKIDDAVRVAIEKYLTDKYKIKSGGDPKPGDSDGDGLLDAWEMQWFGNLDHDGDEDFDGDGLTNRQEMDAGTDPTDYYNGALPSVTIVGGNQQSALPGEFLLQPLTVQVTAAGGRPLANAPIAFTVTSGQASLAGSFGGTTASTLTARTDATGLAKGFVKVAVGVPGPTIVVEAAAKVGPKKIAELFTANTLDWFPSPRSLAVELNAGETTTRGITLQNPTANAVNYTLTPKNVDTPIDYAVRTSDQSGGPSYVWNDIRATGKWLKFTSLNNDAVEAFDLSFAFPFYGSSYTRVYINTNGYLTVGAPSSQTNWGDSFPSSFNPPNCIAPFFYDLQPSTGGEIYALDQGDRVTLQYDSMRNGRSDHTAVTFQVILYKNGEILFLYKSAPHPDDAVAGIQNGDATRGVSVQDWKTITLKDNLAVLLTQTWRWLSVKPTAGTLAAGERGGNEVTFDATQLTGGTYTGTITLQSDYPGRETVDISATLVVNATPVVALTTPVRTTRLLSTQSITFSGTASDPDGAVSKVEFYDGTTKIGETTQAPYAMTWNSAVIGAHSITMQAIDAKGAIGKSKAVTIYIDSDTDGDGLGDQWEMAVFGNLNQTGTGDYDGDGVSNLEEYQRGLTATAIDTDNDGIDDKLEITAGLDPFRNDAWEDPDGDGYPNAFEAVAGSDPRSAASVPAPTFIVDPAGGGTHTTIQAALNATTKSFQIIRVRPGVYKGTGNTNLTAPRPVMLVSEGGAAVTKIDGENINAGITLNNSLVRGFTIQNCRGSQGGGISAGGTTVVESCIIANCFATTAGGGVYANGNITLRHCTIMDNRSDDSRGITGGPAIYVNSNTVLLVNSICWSGTGADIYINRGGISASHSMLQNPTPGEGNVQGGPGLTRDYRLRADSPLRAAGVIIAISSTDIDGEPRPTSSAPDIGADQFIDSDGDGLADAWETKFFGNLARTAIDDPDGDGLDNLTEYYAGTNPTTGGDTDGDGISDYDEIRLYGSNPLLADTDGDGIPDKYEIENGLKVTVRDDMEDADGDGYPNIYEYRNGTRANDPTSFPAANFTVDPTGAGGAFTTLQTAANATTADYQIIRVNPGIYKETGTIVMNVFRFKTLLISAQGAANTIIDGEGVRRGIGASKDCAFVGFTIRNTPEKPTSSTGYGNALSFSNCNVVLQNCVLVNNRGVGGIVSINSGSSFASGTFRHCTFLNNSVSQGETFYLTAGALGGTKLTISDSILWDQGPAQIFAYNTRVAITNSIVRGWPASAVIATHPNLITSSGVLASDPKLTPSGHLTSDSPARGRALDSVYLDMDGEVRTGNGPGDLGADQFVDTDADGLADWWELKYFGNLTAKNGTGDVDGDGLTDLDEYRNDLNPLQAIDTDGDGISDRDEILIYHTNPTLADTDGDDIPDGVEIQYGLDPLRDDALEDADGDGYPNIFEIKRGSNPRLASSIPAPDYTVALSGTRTHSTIPSALTTANGSGQNFRIILVAPGTYPITTSTGIGTQRTLLISSGGATNTIIDGGNISSSLAGISISTRSAIHGFTIRNINHTFSQGGALSFSASARISNCVIRNNAGEMGAVALVNPGHVTFAHCTIVNNTARDSAGSFIVGVDSSVELQNCIVWNPSASSEIKGFGNIVARNTIFRTGSLLGFGIDADPLTTTDGHLRINSPARAAGSPAYTIATDMDGELRPTGTPPDIGADQFSGLAGADADEDGMLDAWEIANGLNPLKPDAFEDADNDGIANVYEYSHNTNPRDPASKPTADIIVDGTPGAADPSHGIYATIRDAVAALTKPYQIIDVRPGTYAGDISLIGANTRGVLIRSTGGAVNTIIDGKGLSGGISASVDAMISGFTFTNCTNSVGAGLYVDIAQVKVVNCVFRGNTATDGQGGAIYVSGGTVQVQHCTVFGNTSKNGIGCGIGASNGSVQVQNSIVWNAAATATGASDIEAAPTSAVTVHASIVHPGGHFTDGGGNLAIDPLLAPATGHLMANSPAIDAADAAVSISTDFENDARPAGVRPDIGADEYVDSDADGLNDGWERFYFGDLSKDANGDADGDGLTNLEEMQFGTSPMKTDTDGDGLSDFAEVRTHHTNPLLADTDGDGTNDGAEVAMGLDPLRDDAYADSDGDGLTNLEEIKLGTNPQKADTDGDGLIDGLEVALGYNPLVKDYVGPDETPPPAPANLKIDEVTPNSVKLSWDPVTDPSAPVTYAVWRNGLLITRTTATSLTDQYGDPGVYAFSYYVTAADAEGNVSPTSATLSGSTAAGFVALPNDADGDGIPDALDAEPNDPANAFRDDDGDGIINRDDQQPQVSAGPPPTLKILNNDDKVSYLVGETMRLTLRVSDPTATVTIFRNDSPLGQAVNVGGDLFEFLWQNLPEGVHQIKAVVKNSSKAAATTKTFLVDVAELEAHITFVGPHPDTTFGRNYSIHSQLDGAEVDRPILRNTYLADYHPADLTQGVDVHYEHYYRGKATVKIYAAGSKVASFKIPPGEKYPLVVLREFRNAAGAFTALQPNVINPSTPKKGETMVKTANFSSSTIFGGFTPYMFYGREGGIDFTAAQALTEATNSAMEFPTRVTPGAIADTKIGLNSNFVSFYSFGDFAISVRPYPSSEYYSVPDFPPNIASLAFTPLGSLWWNKYGGHAYTFIGNPAFYASGGRTLYCYYRTAPAQRGIRWYGSIPILPEIRLTGYNVGSVANPGGRAHPANNLAADNLVLPVNSDSDDTPGVADNSDLVLGDKDDDVVRVNVKVDVRGREDVKQIRMQLPTDGQGNAVLRGFYGNVGSPAVVPGNEFTWALADHPEILTDGGLNFYFEGLVSKADARIKVDVLNADGVPLNRVYATEGEPEMIRLDVVGVSSEVVSRDKFIAGTIELPNLGPDVSLEFTNIATGETFGPFANLSGNGSTRVYNAVEEILADSDLTGQPNTQAVWFVRNATKPTAVDFYTCFNATGKVDIRVRQGGALLRTLTHTLTRADDFDYWIYEVDRWVTGVGFKTPPSDEIGAAKASSRLIMSRAMQADPLFAAAVTPLPRPPINNLTRAALIPFFNVIVQVEGLQVIVQGAMNGIRAGYNDDVDTLAAVGIGALDVVEWANTTGRRAVLQELNQWKNPEVRTRRLLEATRKLCEEWVFKPHEQFLKDFSSWESFRKRAWETWLKSTVKIYTLELKIGSKLGEGLLSWADDFSARMLSESEHAAWLSRGWEADAKDRLVSEIIQTSRESAYIFGYVCGYCTEQVVMGAATAGGLKFAQVFLKGGIKLAATLTARTAFAVTAQAQLLKKTVNEATFAAKVAFVAELGLSKAATTPLSEAAKTQITVVVENALARDGFNRAAMNLQTVWDELGNAARLHALWRAPGQEKAFVHRFAEFFTRMGIDASPEATKGWIRAYDRMLKLVESDLVEDRAADLLIAIRAETAEGRRMLREALEDFAVRTEGKAGQNIPFKLSPRFASVVPTVYNYRAASDFKRMLVVGSEIQLPVFPKPPGYYVTSEIMNDSVTAAERLQLPKRPEVPDAQRAKYRLKIRSTEIADQVEIPYGYNHLVDESIAQTPLIEPLTRENRGLGIGGAPQFTTQKAMVVDEVFDLELGRALTLPEIQTLIQNAQ